MLVWENVFGSWVGWSERDRATLRGDARRAAAARRLLTHGEWTPLAARSDDLRVVGSRWRRRRRRALGAREPRRRAVRRRRSRSTREPSRSRCRRAGSPPSPATASRGLRRRRSPTFPARQIVRVEAPVVPRRRGARRIRRGGRRRGRSSPRFRRARDRHLRRGSVRRGVEAAAAAPARDRRGRAARRRAARFAIGVREVTDADGAPLTGLDLDEARAYAAARGARLPTEDEWQLAAEAGLLERAEPLVWNWTESEHTRRPHPVRDPQGRLGLQAEGSDWYVDGGPQEPAFSLQLLLAGAGSRARRGSASVWRSTCEAARGDPGRRGRDPVRGSARRRCSSATTAPR